MFTVKDNYGGVMIQKIMTPNADNEVEVVFQNDTTDTLTSGTYYYDVRYIINPYYDEQGNIVNGDRVITPKERQQFVLIPIVGDV